MILMILVLVTACQRAVEVRVIENVQGTVASVRCIGQGARLEVGPTLTRFGVPSIDTHAVVDIPNKDGHVRCVAGEGSASFRFRPMRLRGVTSMLVRDGMRTRLVVTIDGDALGPHDASDDGVYLLSDGKLVRALTACPEALWSNERVVACIDAGLLKDRGLARARLQSAGRLFEASGSIDLSVLNLRRGGT